MLTHFQINAYAPLDEAICVTTPNSAPGVSLFVDGKRTFGDLKIWRRQTINNHQSNKSSATGLNRYPWSINNLQRTFDILMGLIV